MRRRVRQAVRVLQSGVRPAGECWGIPLWNPANASPPTNRQVSSWSGTRLGVSREREGALPGQRDASGLALTNNGGVPMARAVLRPPPSTRPDNSDMAPRDPCRSGDLLGLTRCCGRRRSWARPWSGESRQWRQASCALADRLNRFDRYAAIGHTTPSICRPLIL